MEVFKRKYANSAPRNNIGICEEPLSRGKKQRYYNNGEPQAIQNKISMLKRRLVL